MRLMRPIYSAGILLRRQRGFSLMEVLVAMGILSIGLIAVSAIFPTAILLQKQAVEQSLSQQSTRSAEAFLQGKKLSNTTLLSSVVAGTDTIDNLVTAGNSDAFKVYALSEFATGPGTTYLDNWSISDRSFPTITPHYLKREFYWVPLARRTDYMPDIVAWDVFVFILHRDDGKDYTRSFDPTSANWANYDDGQSGSTWDIPGVRRVGVTLDSSDATRFNFDNRVYAATATGEPDQVRMGDLVLADNGVIFKVTDADDAGINVQGLIAGDDQTGRLPASIWYGAPPVDGRSSPTMDIRILSLDVVRSN